MHVLFYVSLLNIQMFVLCFNYNIVYLLNCDCLTTTIYFVSLNTHSNYVANSRATVQGGCSCLAAAAPAGGIRRVALGRHVQVRQAQSRG